MDISQFTSPDHDHTIVSLHDPEHTDAGGDVFLDGEYVMGGAYDDFYPGCHGITEYGDWKGQSSLVNAIELSFLRKGESVLVVEPECHYSHTAGRHVLGPAPAPEPEPEPEPQKPITVLSKQGLSALDELEAALDVIDRVSAQIFEEDRLGEELYGEEELSKRFEDFFDTIEWRKWHAVLRELNDRTNWDEEGARERRYNSGPALGETEHNPDNGCATCPMYEDEGEFNGDDCWSCKAGGHEDTHDVDVFPKTDGPAPKWCYLRRGREVHLVVNNF